ncbi:MAG: phosphoribosylamine--glycine ligase [Verrucomicrobiae bacterium]|nr:phosphoribosylamine--glycine ligase [Verrucomicrobiae bacterium]
MKLLVIGSGGREHALVWKLAQSPHAKRIWCAPGNSAMTLERCAGTGLAPECVPVAAEDVEGLVQFALEQRPDLTVVGPDNPLALGVVDRFQQHRLRIWGPNRRAAQFESSKAFAQNFMAMHGIPTAAAAVFTDAHAAKRFAARLEGRCAIKADGLALGKGVVLAQDLAQAEEAIDDMMVRRVFGDAGEQVVIQEWLEGTEISLHALCDGHVARLFPTAQDHKRALDGDQGLNTGGMGTYSPAPFLTEDELLGAAQHILGPWQRGCAAEGIDFRGVIFPGVMLTPQGPKVLEFNARLGDPETQVYLTRLENDLVELLDASVSGCLKDVPLRWSSQASVCVVMAAEGYPRTPRKGDPIFGLESLASLPNVKAFHAGTTWRDHGWFTNGGRVLGITAWAPTLEEAQERAYAAVDLVQFEGAHYRRDIGAKALGHGPACE